MALTLKIVGLGKKLIKKSFNKKKLEEFEKILHLKTKQPF